MHCVCTLSDKAPIKNEPGTFEYTFRCNWMRDTGDAGRIDTNSYTVMVEATNDGDAMNLAKKQCPYDPPKDA